MVVSFEIIFPTSEAGERLWMDVNHGQYEDGKRSVPGRRFTWRWSLEYALCCTVGPLHLHVLLIVVHLDLGGDVWSLAVLSFCLRPITVSDSLRLLPEAKPEWSRWTLESFIPAFPSPSSSSPSSTILLCPPHGSHLFTLPQQTASHHNASHMERNLARTAPAETNRHMQRDVMPASLQPDSSIS